MASDAFGHSYSYKLVFYALVLLLPLVLMTGVESIAAGSAISITGDNPSKFLMFLAYFLPGLLITRQKTHSTRRILGMAVAYIMLTPAYYLYAIQFACRMAESCVSV